ncbi:MAG: S9 family peptidase [Deltaproteobacteria bacterium]|nr:S9 family peptidase [Deltaproteobacteria bacterium]
MPRPITPEDLWKLRRVGLPSVAQSGRFAVVGVKSYDVQANEGREVLHRVEPGAPPIPLTDPDASASAPAISPDERLLAFVRKPRRGEAPANEHAQLHVMSMSGGEARRLGEFPLGCDDPRWLPDGRRVVVVAQVHREAMTLAGTRERVLEGKKRKVRAHVTEDRVYRFWDRWLTDGLVPHLFVVDVETGAVRDLTPESDRWFDLMDEPGQYDVSPDGKEIVFAANSSRPPHDRLRWALYTVDVDPPDDPESPGAGEVRCLTPEQPADDIRPRYSPDGRFVAFGMRRDDYYGDRVRLSLVDRETGAIRVLTESWDMSPSEWSWRDARTLVGVVDERARVSLFELPIEAGSAPRMLVREGTMHGVGVGADGSIWVQHQSLVRPPEIARIVLAGASGAALERVSGFNDALLSELDLGAPEEVEIDGAGGDRVQMFVLRPPGFDGSEQGPEKKWPLVHLIHGGPYGVFGDTWHFRWNAQVIAASGCVVAMVNFHGSASFGEAFARSILGDWGGKPAEDVLRATDALIARGFVDEERVAITGGSYGGYLTCWLATQTDRFRCAIAHAAVFNLSTLYGSDVTQGTDLEMGAVPWGDQAARDLFARWDPARASHGYRTPMLVIHGELDYRVPVTHGLELYGILKAKGVEARLVYYPDENHWILAPQSSLHWYGEFLGWLRRHLF